MILLHVECHCCFISQKVATSAVKSVSVEDTSEDKDNKSTDFQQKEICQDECIFGSIPSYKRIVCEHVHDNHHHCSMTHRMSTLLISHLVLPLLSCFLFEMLPRAEEDFFLSGRLL